MFEILRTAPEADAIQGVHLAMRMLRHRSAAFRSLIAQRPLELLEAPPPEAAALALQIVEEIEKMVRKPLAEFREGEAAPFMSILGSQLIEKVGSVQRSEIERADHLLDQWRRAS